jgi:organic radical activating enzyme
MERYKVTPEDRARISLRENTLKVSGDQIFATLQGEGVTSGSKAVFLRLHFCNLKCSWCDTTYTWNKNNPEFWQEPQDWSFPQTVNKIEKSWQEKFSPDTPISEKRVVITGGEPLLQQNKIVEVIKHLPNWNVEIETNGTIMPLPELSNCQFNCSPKLENSGNEKQKRYKPEVLEFINSLPNSWFKFVVSETKDLEEIDQIVSECGLIPEKILIMPEGHTIESTSKHLTTVEKAVSERGWKVAKRNQLEWFGNKRRT